MPRKASTAAAPVVSGAWPAEQVEMRAIAGLIPYAQNARMHSATQIDQIAASIREWGWTVPILVDETGRACHAIELSPAYVDVAIARWQAFTGATSVLERQPGGTFLELSGQRSAAA